MAEDLQDDFDEDDFDEEDLQWSCNYVVVCILLPTLIGFINGFFWSGLALHYVDMGWAVARAGLASTIGLLLRPFFQQIQIRAGFWAAVPLGALHLGLAILGAALTTQEWAVILEVTALQGLDPSITIEGIAFDVFGLSETMARQASSTVLAVFTIAVATAVTIGGIIYDFAGWQGMSLFHVACQSAALCLFTAQPVVWKSFREYFFKAAIPGEESEATASALSVVPAQPSDALPKQELGLVVEDLTELPGTVRDVDQGGMPAGTMTGGISRESTPEGDAATDRTRGSTFAPAHLRGFSRESSPEGDAATDRTGSTSAPAHLRGSQVSGYRGSTLAPPHARGSQVSGCQGSTLDGAHHRRSQLRNSCASAMTLKTRQSRQSRQSATSRLTSLTNLKDSNDFQHHFMASNVLRPTIAQRAGQGQVPEVPEVLKSKGVPKDLRVPLGMIALCCFCNNMCYNMEFGTFAIFFKEYHGWEAATWASLAQAAGDFVAAVMMKVLKNNVEEVENPSSLRRMTMQPYNLVCLLICWIVLNLGMISPLLPIAVTAQILMGTVYVYVMKMTNDLNLFYSLGDTSLYLTLQVYCKNAEACGGALSSFLGPFLFEVMNPFFPFLLSAVFSAVTFLLFTAGFCRRVGCLDIETAEARRSRRLGTKRISQWSVVSRKNTVPKVVSPEEVESVHG